MMYLAGNFAGPVSQVKQIMNGLFPIRCGQTCVRCTYTFALMER